MKACVLQTRRLLLRPITMDDCDAFLDIFSDEETLKYWSRETISNLDDAKALVQQELDRAESGGSITWGIALPDSNLLIGKFTLFQFSERNLRAEVGYVLDRRQWGQGYMTETMAAALAHAFDVLKLHRVEADTDPGNTASLALLEKFGFSREGLFRDRWLMDEKWFDSVMLGLLENDYRKLDL